MNTDEYYEKLLKDKELQEDAHRGTTQAVHTGIKYGLIGSLIFCIPLFGYFLWILETT